METKDVILQLRIQNGWTQEELAEKLCVTRQAVSRWETGETTPNPETLKQLSALFDVSLHALLGAPRQLICQCCGMPLEESSISKEPDGTPNEAYCKWCYADGTFTYSNLEELIAFLAGPPVQQPLAPGAGPRLLYRAAAQAGPLAFQGMILDAENPGRESRPGFVWLDCLGSGQRSGDDGHLVNLIGVTAPGEVIDGGVQALENGAVGGEAAQALAIL